MPHCNQCEADWQNRANTPHPIQCPRCKRVDWAEPKKARRLVHLSEIRELTPVELEALPKPGGPSIMAEGFPVTIPAYPAFKTKRAGTVGASTVSLAKIGQCPECFALNGMHQRGCSKR